MGAFFGAGSNLVDIKKFQSASIEPRADDNLPRSALNVKVKALVWRKCWQRIKNLQ